MSDLKEKFFWYIMDNADMKEIDGVQYVEFQWLCDALDKFQKEKMNAFLDGAGQGIIKGLEMGIRKGEWIKTETTSNNNYKCSCCGHSAGRYKHDTYKFCPWCGADMRGEA